MHSLKPAMTLTATREEAKAKANARWPCWHFSQKEGNYPQGSACTPQNGIALAGRLVLDEAVVDPEHEARWNEYCNRHRCDSQSRGSVYDSKAGICCHFCRQKKLCGEEGCQRCIQRDPDLPCIGALPPAVLHAQERASQSMCTASRICTASFARAWPDVRPVLYQAIARQLSHCVHSHSNLDYQRLSVL